MKIQLNHFSDLPVLETDRLFLKPLNKEFLSQKYVNWLNDESVNRYLDSGGDYNFKKLTNYLEGVELNPSLFWAIIQKEKNKHIGNIKIDPIDKKNLCGEYGIMIGDKNEWGKGIAKETSLSVVNFCFNRLGLKKINLGVIALHTYAIKLYESIGFKQEACLKSDRFFEGSLVDVLRMSILNTK